MSFSRRVTMRKRVTSAVGALVVNAVLWIVVPYYLGIYLAGVVPDLALTIPAFVFEFGVLFIVLDVGAAFFQGMAVSVPFLSGAALLSAVYLWLVTNGGNLHVSASGTTIGLQFQLLLYVLVLPSLWAALRAPLSYLAWRGAVQEPPAVP